jgi:nitrous oxidase accessory protein NosD
MRKSIHSVILSVSVLLMLSTMAFGGTHPLVVSPAGDDFQRIQDAIEAAEDGGVIVIRPGTYRENLVIVRPLSILGGEGVFLEPADAGRPTICIDRTEAVTIQALVIRMATVGIDISRSSCTISNCSISASETGIRIVAFDTDAVSILFAILQGSGQGTGVEVVGSGRASLMQCEFSGLATGILIGGTGTTVVVACTVESCYEAAVLSDTTHVVFMANTLRGNHANAIRLDPITFPADEGTLRLVDNEIDDNDGWGLTLCGPYGTAVDAAFGCIVGSGNSFSGNGLGDVCPEALPLPEGFVLE